MARFFIDEREIALPPNTYSFGQIVKQVEDIHLPARCAIRKICVDGLSLSPDILSGDNGGILSQLENHDKIEIFTGTLSEIARDSIIETIAYLDRVEAVIPPLATGFQMSPGPESFENLYQLCEGFYWLNLLLDKLATNLQITLNNVLIKERPVREHLQKFMAILRQLADSQERRDFVLIAGLLESEVLPLVAVWKEIFSFVSQKVDAAQQGPKDLSNDFLGCQNPDSLTRIWQAGQGFGYVPSKSE